ncbi:MAG: hypothetical protein K2X66_00690 [Cyanobacteria bacterium]|nr:hypothetical protein [Cyanobacteriota bacterium]
MGSKKAWLIGCGGCLTVIIIAAIILGIWGYSSFTESSNKSAKAVFGEKLPEGYIPFGIPMGKSDTDNQHFVMLVNGTSGKFMMALEMPSEDPATMATLLQNPEALSATIESQLAQSGSSSSGKIHKIETSQITLPSKEKYPSFNIVLNQREKYVPLVGTLLTYTTPKMIILIVMDPNKGSTDANTDFAPMFAPMNQELEKVLGETEITKNMQMPSTNPETMPQPLPMDDASVQPKADPEEEDGAFLKDSKKAA